MSYDSLLMNYVLLKKTRQGKEKQRLRLIA